MEISIEEVEAWLDQCVELRPLLEEAARLLDEGWFDPEILEQARDLSRRIKAALEITEEAT